MSLGPLRLNSCISDYFFFPLNEKLGQARSPRKKAREGPLRWLRATLCTGLLELVEYEALQSAPCSEDAQLEI